jgi:predicted nucleotidyltransferase component of viral defense system
MLERSNPYYRQVAILLDVLPLVAKEACFALKGGTAINLFLRDLPRLSVDIDLTYLPVQDRSTSLAEIGAALERIAMDIERILQGVRVQLRRQDGQVIKLFVARDGVQVKIEVSPVLRGAVRTPVRRSVSPAVAAQFGEVEVLVLHAHDIYAGKLCAALDRQHPRDLFDVQRLLESEGVDDDLLEVFLVYLASSDRPLADLLAPIRQPMARVFEEQFRGMALMPVTLVELEETRERLMAEIGQRLSERQRQFLLSFKAGEPDWGLLNLEGAAELPAVRWKLQHIRKMSPAKHQVVIDRLRAVLYRDGHV